MYSRTSLQRPPPQRQRPLKRVPTAKITSRQRPVNQRQTNGVYKTTFYIVKGRKRDLYRAAFLFGFRFIDIIRL